MSYSCSLKQKFQAGKSQKLMRKKRNDIEKYRLKGFMLLLISTLTSDPLQVYQDAVSGRHVASAEGAPATLVLGHDV